MLSRFFKKRDGVETPPATPATPPGPHSKEAKARQAEGARAEWLPRVQAAHGDDAALLQIAQTAPLWEIRVAAVEALASEEALKQAERELRTQDSRVHRAAKRRHTAAVAQREARAAAHGVIDAATALAAEAPLPANRLVAIDRDWQAIDAGLLEPAQTARFAELREQLNALLREQGEQQQRRQQEQQRLIAEAQQAQAEAEAARLAELAAAAPPAPEPEAEVVAAPPPAPKKSLSPEQKQQLDTLLTEAETALAEGQLSVMQQQLQAVDAALDALHGISVGDKLRARHQALHAERGRLKGWQQWGGALALDALVAEAEALAQATLAAADPEVKAPKLRIKAHADAIQAMRARWKEIDRVGAPSNQALWQRFDAALQIAYQPVAAQQATVKAARQENLQAREALLDALDAVPMGEAPATPDEQAAHWKEPLRALGSFQLAWRQLGPLEHTVPSAAKNALQQRLRSSIERIEAPIEEARRVAEAQRERLIARAEGLVQELNRNPATRDAMPRVRELQAEWQQHARSLPLARAAENALWARFKAATDAVFKQREAAFNARDAELAANLAAREALIESLAGIDLAATPVADLQRALNDADRAWRTPVEVPRAAVNALDVRFRDARAAVAQAVAESAHKRWQVQCDTLAAKLALCEEREAAAGEGAELAGRWAACETLPAAWEKPLAQRWSQPMQPGPLAEAACDDLLLQLEAALDLPATAEQQAARRDLKLRALKDALEGRAAQSQDPAVQRNQWFAAALRQSGLTPAQRERLGALIAALRQAVPGSLGGTAR
jgi:DNA repair protein SbcC/Rad50